MDGLTISNSNAMLSTGSTLKEIRDSKIAPQNNTGAIGSTDKSQKTFADTLKDAVQNVNTTMKEADVKAQDLAVGKAQSIEDVMIATEKANIAYHLMTSVRNKIIEAYQDIMKMQV
jgi:flagellar hook-basal body complex protein FliE